MDSPKRGRDYCVISLGWIVYSSPEPVRSVAPGVGRAGGGRIGRDRRALEPVLRGAVGHGEGCVEEGLWHMRFGASVQHDVGG